MCVCVCVCVCVITANNGHLSHSVCLSVCLSMSARVSMCVLSF